MLKKITAVLLGVCVTSMTLTGVSAADFSDGLFSDGSDDTQTGDISAIANQIVAQAQNQAQDYQEKKQAAQKVIDAREVERRAQEIKEETTRIREEAQEAARKKAEEEARKAEQARVEHRENIAQFAVQFVGNPYVYGGTSLTNGADCSGFIWAVYRQYGYGLPRNSAAMRSAGREVSYEAAQAGDIVCYAGHVALYLGGGRIVHASTARTGIKYGYANYKPILTIRRIVG